MANLRKKNAAPLGPAQRLAIEDRRRRRVRLAGIIIAVWAVIALLYGVTMRGRYTHFTRINGLRASGKTPQAMAEKIERLCSEMQVTIFEDDMPQLTTTLADLGFSGSGSVDETIRTQLGDISRHQVRIFPFSLIHRGSYSVDVPFTVNESMFDAKICAASFVTPRVETTNAKVVKTADGISVQDEVYGTSFNDEKLRHFVREEIETAIAEGLGKTLRIDIPDSLYDQPEILAGDPIIESEKKLFEKYCDFSLTYEFGSETRTVNWDTVSEWIKEENGEAVIDNEQVYTFVSNLAAETDTYYMSRTFKTHSGREIHPAVHQYGYAIWIDGEYSQFLLDMESNTAVRREPVYGNKGLSRNGMNDLLGSYVEVDISGQHLWVYKNNQLVVETDVVTGLPTEERATLEGMFTIPYKASPYNLKGGGGSDEEGWDVEVQYWMPFCDGQGLHDAYWQYSFGGDAYMWNGSHGCVNLPSDVAGTIYDAVEPNYPIILYRDTTT